MSKKEEEGLEVVEASSVDEAQKRARRPRTYSMQNGFIEAEDLFLYVPRETLRKDDVNRFLKLCDLLIIELGPKELTQTEVKDIAALYRDVMIRDHMYELTKDNDAKDKTILTDMLNVSKQIDTLQRGLKLNAAQRAEERRKGNELTMMDLLGKFRDNEELFAMFELQQQKILDKYQKGKYTDVDEYMTLHTAGEILEDSKHKVKGKGSKK
jgi:hypothetical protein